MSGFIYKIHSQLNNYISLPAKETYNWQLFQFEISRNNISRVAFFSLIIAVSDFLIGLGLHLFYSFNSNIQQNIFLNYLIYVHLLIIITFTVHHLVAKQLAKDVEKNQKWCKTITWSFSILSIAIALTVSLIEEKLGGITSIYLIVICTLLIIFHWNLYESLILLLGSNFTYLLVLSLFNENGIINKGQMAYTIMFSLIFFLLSRNHFKIKLQEFIQLQEIENQSKILKNKNEELNIAHSTLSSINKNIVQGFFRVDQEGNLLYANKFLADLFGFNSPEDMINQWHPSGFLSKEELLAMRKELLSKKFIKNKEISFSRPSRAFFWGIINCYQETQNGKVCFDGTLIDNTERKNEQTLLENLSLVASKTDNAVFIIDNDEKIEWVNDAFTNQTGYTVEEAKGKKPGSLFQGKNIDPNTILQIGDRISKGLSFTGEMLNYHKDGYEFWVHMALNPILNRNNEIVKYVVVQSDITERKNVEKELIKAKEEAERLVKVKEEFLSMVSHELRTPLNAVIGMSHLLLQESPRPDQVQSLQSLKVSAEYLLSLINDILDFSKIEAGKITIDNSAFNFYNFIHSVEQTFFYLAEEKNIQFTLKLPPDVPPAIVGDPVRLNQILFNLLSNAIKFTDNGVVELDIEIIHQNTQKVVLDFYVRDTGMGIPQDKLQTIFDRFEQVNPNSTISKRGGTGLGLAITKSLIEMMGGSIKVDSTVNVGSTFSFQLAFDINQQEVTEHKIQDYNVDNFEKLNLLLVEDNKINQLVAIKFMKKWNINHQVVENGQLAYEEAQRNQFNMILMDLQMPEMDGYESSRLIRKLDGYENIPIIALTAASLEAKDDVYSAGMNDFIIKPFNPVDLYSKIKTHCQKIVGTEQIASNEAETINISEIQRIACGDQQFLLELLDICIEQFTTVPLQLQKAFAENQPDTILGLMHKIKPSIKMLRDFDLEKSASQLITAINKNVEHTNKQMKKLENFIAITSQINQKLKSKSNELKSIIS